MTFKKRVEAKYVVEEKFHGFGEHPFGERLRFLKKQPPKQKGPTTVIGYDFPSGMWEKLFDQFEKEFKSVGVELKPPLDKTPHVTLSYIINATQEELDAAKKLAKGITPMVASDVSFLKGNDGKIYIALDYIVTPEYRRAFNAIENLVGQDRVVNFRKVWQGHIPHTSIGTVEKDFPERKKVQAALTKIAKAARISFQPNFVEVHVNTKVGGPFVPECTDWEELK